MANRRYMHTFGLNEKQEFDFVLARAHFKPSEIVQMGIAEALKRSPEPSRALIEKVKKQVLGG